MSRETEANGSSETAAHNFYIIYKFYFSLDLVEIPLAPMTDIDY